MYLYQIAEINIYLNVPWQVQLTAESELFFNEVSEKEFQEKASEDEYLKFESTLYKEVIPQNGYFYDFQYHCNELTSDIIYFSALPKENPYAAVTWSHNQDQPILCQYRCGTEAMLDKTCCVLRILSLETLLLRHHGLLLHASFIRWNGQGILFSAPSGIGKSTQANLWETYENAEILNGDRAGIRFVEEKWYAYGLPYAGSSEIYRNEKAPVKAIVVLKQAPENRVRKLSVSEAFGYLYPEFTLHRWDKRFCDIALNYILELLSAVPVYLLECLPDQSAVSVLKNELFPYGKS